ncbi:helix-turn-helix domain-containing protein [Haloferula chungangensis]|uniref:Helix-turn-helix domain-containing protein n=1 Tax=Haloferula chungangensis TaxID=1048331 RepID=A0ABW2L298_9BACT
MQSAQNHVAIQRGAQRCLRGSIRGAGLGEYSEALGSSWDASFVQLSAGPLGAAIDYLAGDRFVLYRESWAQRLQAVGSLLPGMIVFGIPERPEIGGRWWGGPLLSGRLPYARSGDELDLLTEPGEVVTTLAMIEDDFREIFLNLTGLVSDEVLKGGRFIVVRPDGIPHLLTRWRSYLAASKQSRICEFGIADIVSPLVDAIVLPVENLRPSVRGGGVIERVLLMAEQSAFSASVAEISHSLKISRRTIEYTFKQCLGTPPNTYFKLRRLEQCRLELIEADGSSRTVASIATHYGFHELGRFSALYRHYFGILPSATLRQPPQRAKAQVAPLIRH